MGKCILPKPGEPGFTIPPFIEGNTYYISHSSEGILGEDENGEEVEADAGWYFQQWDPKKDQGVDGYFGPYESPADMPDIVKENLIGLDHKSVFLSDLLINAKQLVYEPSGSEYERGILGLLAYTFGEEGVTTDERMVELAKRLGWPTEWKGAL